MDGFFEQPVRDPSDVPASNVPHGMSSTGGRRPDPRGVINCRIEQLEAEVVHRQLLLEEVIHRTKNTLQLAVAILGDKIDEARDAGTRRTVREVQKHFLTLCHAHDRFYGPTNAPGTSLGFRIYEICSSICESFGRRVGNITLSLNVAEVPLTRHREISMNLILQELVLNALKHAFRGRAQGTITIELGLDDQSMCHLIVRDDGIGPTAGRGENSRGLYLVEAFAAGLQGRVATSHDQGTTTTISFPLHEERCAALAE
jgi:two-component sensor histidine kinase